MSGGSDGLNSHTPILTRFPSALLVNTSTQHPPLTRLRYAVNRTSVHARSLTLLWHCRKSLVGYAVCLLCRHLQINMTEISALIPDRVHYPSHERQQRSKQQSQICHCNGYFTPAPIIQLIKMVPRDGYDGWQ